MPENFKTPDSDIPNTVDTVAVATVDTGADDPVEVVSSIAVMPWLKKSGSGVDCISVVKLKIDSIVVAISLLGLNKNEITVII